MNKKILMILAITVLAMEAGAEIKPLSVYSGHHINQVPHTTGSSKRCAMSSCDNFVGAGKVFSAAEGIGEKSWHMKRGKLSKRPTTRWDELMTAS